MSLVQALVLDWGGTPCPVEGLAELMRPQPRRISVGRRNILTGHKLRELVPPTA